MRISVRRLAALIGSSWGILATACVDTSPLSISNDGGAVTSDAVSEEVARTNPACHACIVAPNDPGPGCANEMEVCAATPSCSFIYECAYTNGCVFKMTRSESIACAFPCAKDLTNAYDQAITAALALTMCFHAQCHDVCASPP